MRHTSFVPALLVSTLAALALGACDRNPASQAPAAAPAPAPAATTAQPAVATVATVSSNRTPTFKGYGDLKFGMNSKEMHEAWKAPIAIAPSPGCQMVALGGAAPKALTLMIEGDKLVRYDVTTNAETAPGGGQVGMGIDQVRKLYDGRIREQPDKYVPGGIDLRVSADDDSGSALVFQTGADGKVSAWRVGQPPAIDYTEGCS